MMMMIFLFAFFRRNINIYLCVHYYDHCAESAALGTRELDIDNIDI